MLLGWNIYLWLVVKTEERKKKMNGHQAKRKEQEIECEIFEEKEEEEEPEDTDMDSPEKTQRDVRDELKAAAKEAGIEKEQVAVEEVGGAVDSATGLSVEDDNTAGVQTVAWNYGLKNMAFWMIGVFVFALTYLICLSIVGILLQFYFTPLLVWGFLPFPIAWICVIFWGRQTTRDCASPIRVVESFCLGVFLDIPLVLIQWFLSSYVLKVTNYLLEQQDSMILLAAILLIYIIFDSFVIQAIPEECIKYVIVWRLRNSTDLRSRYGAVIYGVAAAGGVATISGVLTVLQLYWSRNLKHAALAFAVASTLECGVHIIAGIWVGSGAAKKFFRKEGSPAYPLWKVLLPPVVINACYMLFLQAIELLDEAGLLEWWLFATCLAFAAIFVITIAAFSLNAVNEQTKNPRYYAPVSIADSDEDEDGWML